MMDNTSLNPQEIYNKMYEKDTFSQWLGIKLLSISEGYCKLEMTLRPEMTNGFTIAHGGISFSFADSAFAFASNSRGRHAVSIETSISHTKSIEVGETIYAEAIEKSLSNRLAIYDVTVTNQKNELVALFKGTVFRKNISWS